MRIDTDKDQGPMLKNQTVRGTPATEAQRAAAQALVDEHGDAKAAKILGLQRATLARVVAGFPLIEGTHAQLREKLGGAQ